MLACVGVLGGCALAVPGRPVPGGPGPPSGPGVEVLDEVPELPPSTAAPRIDHGDVCGSIPAAALAELGFGEPHDRWFVFCQWLDKRDGHHFVNVGYDERRFTDVVEQVDPERLSHLRILRIEGHYAVEEILEYDPMQACSVRADYGAAETLLVTTYTGTETSTNDAVGPLCAKSRQAAAAVLRQFGRS